MTVRERLFLISRKVRRAVTASAAATIRSRRKRTWKEMTEMGVSFYHSDATDSTIY